MHFAKLSNLHIGQIIQPGAVVQLKCIQKIVTESVCSGKPSFLYFFCIRRNPTKPVWKNSEDMYLFMQNRPLPNKIIEHPFSSLHKKFWFHISWRLKSWWSANMMVFKKDVDGLGSTITVETQCILTPVCLSCEILFNYILYYHILEKSAQKCWETASSQYHGPLSRNNLIARGSQYATQLIVVARILLCWMLSVHVAECVRMKKSRKESTKLAICYVEKKDF